MEEVLCVSGRYSMTILSHAFNCFVFFLRSKIALLTGGYTNEAKISYKSVVTIRKHIDRTKFDVYDIDIRKDGWYYIDDVSNNKPIIIDRNDFSLTIDNKKIKFDCVFMCIHGSPGEDGKLEGYFDILEIPYTGCSGARCSALTMNKRLTIAVAGFHGINVAKSMCIEKSSYDRSKILQYLKLPVFVKPNNGGSSIGTTCVEEADDLSAALDTAFKEDDEVLVEEAIPGREFTIGVYKLRGKTDTLPITEIRSKNKFFDYDAKYNGQVIEETPAQIDTLIEAEIQKTAIKVYEIMKCSWIARIDVIYNQKDNKVYLLEVNTVPGQTDTSIVPQQVEAKGWTLKDMYTAFVEEVLNLPPTTQL